MAAIQKFTTRLPGGGNTIFLQRFARMKIAEKLDRLEMKLLNIGINGTHNKALYLYQITGTMEGKITIQQYAQAVETIKKFEDQTKASLTVEGFLQWYESPETIAPKIVRALTILQTTKPLLFSITGKDMKHFSGFATSYPRGRFDLARESYFNFVLNGLLACVNS